MDLIERRIAAWLWLAVIAVLALVVWRWSVTPGAVNSDILTLLPSRPHADLIDQAQDRLADAAARRVVIMVGGGELDSAIRSGDAMHDVLAKQSVFSRVDYRLDPARMAAVRNFYAVRHDALLTAHQRAALQADQADIFIAQAIQAAYSPIGAPGGLSFKDDPFQFFSAWQMEQAAMSRLRPAQDRLVAVEGGKHYVALFLEISGSAFDAAIQERVAAALNAAGQVAGNSEMLSAGVINFATAIQRQAQREVSLIGSGSLLGIALLILAAFRSVRPLFIAVLPIAIGCLAAIAACHWLFGGIHILTLVFGSSLVGVSVDYGLHFLCHLRREDDAPKKFARLRTLLPGLGLALATSVLAYLTLAIPNFPGLRQMAVFSGVGLVFAWLTTVIWLPRLAHGGIDWNAALPRALQAMRGKPTAWPSRLTMAAGIVGLIVASLGLFRIEVNDDIRILQSMPPQLLAEQQRVATLAGVASPAQFLLVRDTTPEALLQREEAVRAALDDLLARKHLENYQAVSRWAPSIRRQGENRRLLEQRVHARGGWLDRLSSELGLPADALKTSATNASFTIDDWLASPASEAQRHLWLGRMGQQYASVITLQGITGADGARAIRESVSGIDGVAWVDRAADISTLLGGYRREMSWVAGLGYALVFLALIWRYRRRAWRAIAPTALATLLTLGLLGWLAIPINLFTVLALLLVLGVGIDYGIYMQEEAGHQATAAWVGVSLSAITTLLSFGLLALSQTPALFTFGLTMLFGVSLTWLLAWQFARHEAWERQQISNNNTRREQT